MSWGGSEGGESEEGREGREEGGRIMGSERVLSLSTSLQ